MELKNQIEVFREKIGKERVVLIQHHTDLDGYASGFISYTALDRSGKYVRIRPSDRKKLWNGKTVLLTDISLDFNARGIAQKLYAIDHHPWPDYPENITFVNPHATNVPQPSKWNAGLLAFLTFEDIVPELEWVAAVSVISDSCEGDHVPINMDFEGIEETAHKLSALTHFRGTSHRIYRYFKIEYKNVVSDKKLDFYYKKFKSEVEKYSLESAEYLDEEAKLAVIRVDSELNRIASPVSTFLSKKHPDWIIIAYEDGKTVKASLRCQSGRVDLGKICRDHGSGGGHAPAAGARVPREKFPEFIKFVRERVLNS